MAKFDPIMKEHLRRIEEKEITDTYLKQYTHAALRVRNFDLPDSLMAMTGSSRKNLRKFDIQSQNVSGTWF